jgi:hypothetical protein
MSDRLDTSFLEDAMHYASREARHSVADALACHLHNDGYALDGNTEANDVEWFARTLWERTREYDGGWDRQSDELREAWRQTVRGVLAVLPDFQLRVAHRLITLSKVVRDIERSERKQRDAVRSGRASP